jgi:hypothetical protein
LDRNQPQQGRSMPQHAKAAQHEAANSATRGELARAVELDTSMTAAMRILFFTIGLRSSR